MCVYYLVMFLITLSSIFFNSIIQNAKKHFKFDQKKNNKWKSNKIIKGNLSSRKAWQITRFDSILVANFECGKFLERNVLSMALVIRPNLRKCDFV